MDLVVAIVTSSRSNRLYQSLKVDQVSTRRVNKHIYCAKFQHLLGGQENCGSTVSDLTPSIYNADGTQAAGTQSYSTQELHTTKPNFEVACHQQPVCRAIKLPGQVQGAQP